MDLSGAGARAVITLALRGPLTLEQLVGDSGVSRRALWAGIAQAEKLGLMRRIKRGRTTFYSSALSSTPHRDLTTFGPDKNSSSIYTYRDEPGAKTALQSAEIAPSHDGLDAIIAPDQRPGAKTALQEAIIAPSGNLLDAEIAPSPLDQIIAADQMRAPDVSNRVGSPYVLRRAAQRQAITALWEELLPGKPIPPRTTLDTLLLEANNSAYFLGVVIQDMTAAGKDIEWPIGYIKKAVQGRKQRGDIPLLPIVSDQTATDDVTPELRAYFDRAEAEGQTYWGSDDD